MSIPKQLGKEGFNWWFGVVNDIDKEYQVGMVYVAVVGANALDEKDKDRLLKCQVILPTTSQSVEGIGDTPQVDIGSKVFGFYTDQTASQGFILGTIPVIPNLDQTLNSVSFLARGKQIDDDKKLHPVEPDPSFKAEYPNNRVIRSRTGHTIELDDTPDAPRVHIRHSSGSKIEMRPDGSIVMKSVKDSFEIVGGKKDIAITGDCNIEVQGNLNATAQGDITLAGQRDVSILAKGRLFLQGMLGIKVSSGAGTAIEGPGGLAITEGSLSVVGNGTMGTGVTGNVVAGGKNFSFKNGVAVGLS
jgi:hypothetical protein